MKKITIAFSVMLLILFGCNESKSKEKAEAKVDKENTIPGYNPNAVSVNSIAPDQGIADPHVLIQGDTIYAMFGSDKDWDLIDACYMERWEMWSSTNLTDWEHKLNILPTQTYIGDKEDCWAGDIATRNGKYYWYFSNRNIDVGVMSAPTINGPWTDALGKPLLPKGLTSTKSYDPDIIEEDGVYYMVFGIGKYHIVELGEDMISLAGTPQKLIIQNEDGTVRRTRDKPEVFKRGDWYYLFYGHEYAMSKKLKGPYKFMGDYIHGGHGTAFEWKGQWYSMQENHETNAFYRGVQIRPLYFNDDNTIYIPEVNWEYPLPGRSYEFTHSTQGWDNEKGTTVNRNESPIHLYGKTESKGAIIASKPFLHTPLYLCENVKIVTKRVSESNSIKLALNGYDYSTGFTKRAPQKVDWDKEEWISVDVKETDDWQEIVIPLSQFKTRNKFLHQIAVQPVPGLDNADWIIKSVIVE